MLCHIFMKDGTDEDSRIIHSGLELDVIPRIGERLHINKENNHYWFHTKVVDIDWGISCYLGNDNPKTYVTIYTELDHIIDKRDLK